MRATEQIRKRTNTREDPRRDPDGTQGPREGPGQRLRISETSAKRNSLRGNRAIFRERASGAESGQAEVEDGAVWQSRPSSWSSRAGEAEEGGGGESKWDSDAVRAALDGAVADEIDRAARDDEVWEVRRRRGTRL